MEKRGPFPTPFARVLPQKNADHKRRLYSLKTFPTFGCFYKTASAHCTAATRCDGFPVGLSRLNCLSGMSQGPMRPELGVDASSRALSRLLRREPADFIRCGMLLCGGFVAMTEHGTTEL